MRIPGTRPLAYALLLGGIVVLLLARAPTSHADIGPKPSAEFEFEYQIPPVPIVSGTLWLCDDKQCTEKHVLEDAGLQHFRCDADRCSSRAYGYEHYLKLEITFADRVRESDVFQKRDFDSVFTVSVTESGLRVREKRRLFDAAIILALAFTLGCETMVAAIYRRIRSLPRSLLLWTPVASLLTLPVIWLGFTRLSWRDYSILCAGEVFAVIFEAGFLFLVQRRKVPLRDVALLSLIMNFASFVLPVLADLLLRG